MRRRQQQVDGYHVDQRRHHSNVRRHDCADHGGFESNVSSGIPDDGRRDCNQRSVAGWQPISDDL